MAALTTRGRCRGRLPKRWKPSRGSAGPNAERALGRAETYLRKKRFEDATLELARARELDPDAAALRAFEDRLRDSMAESARETQSAREAADAIAAARRAFSGGHRDQALADLRSFGARVPEAVVAVEIGRLEAEAKRIVAAEQRAAEAAEHATAAEAALAAGDPQGAQDRASPRARDCSRSPARAQDRRTGRRGGEAAG